MRLAVDPRTGGVRLTVPRRASLQKALAWAEQQRAWIDAQQAKLPQGRPFVPGAHIPLSGTEIEIAWAATHPRTPKLAGDQLLCGGPLESLPGRVERWLRAQALAVLSAETAEYAERANVDVASVAVGDAKGRWGSCTSSGTIRYSWRLILAPPEVRRATVAHEVAHRIHMHHGPAFHRLVDTLYEGDVEPTRHWLRRHGAALHWVGRESGPEGLHSPPSSRP